MQLSATRALYRGPEGSGGDLFGCSGTVGTARRFAWDTRERTEPAGAPILSPQPASARGSDGECPGVTYETSTSRETRSSSRLAVPPRLAGFAMRRLRPGRRERFLCIRRTSRAQRRQAGRRASSSTVSSAAAARSSVGIHSGEEPRSSARLSERSNHLLANTRFVAQGELAPGPGAHGTPSHRLASESDPLCFDARRHRAPGHANGDAR